VVEYFDSSEWEAAAEPIASLTFTEFSNDTLLTTQYAALGATFTDGNDIVITNPAFIDGHGLRGGQNQTNADIDVAFDRPMHALAVALNGTLRVDLYWQDELLFSGEYGGPVPGVYIGLISGDPFDKAVLARTGIAEIVSIDNLYFSDVPAPSGLALILLAGLDRNTRRKRSS